MTARLSPGETVARPVKLPADLDRRLRARALLTDVPISAIVREAIAEYLAARGG